MITSTDLLVLGEDEAAAHIVGICLKKGPPQRVGVELEWLVRDTRDPCAPVSPEQARAAFGRYAGHHGCGELPSGAPLTSEPGGQLEVSSLPADSLADCVRATVADMAALREAATAAGLELIGCGLDPLRRPRRVLAVPRYAAMEAYFDRRGPWGRWMMCSTASVQVCLDAGDDSHGWSGYRWRWRLLHAIGPVLVAAFANSPLRRGRPTGWRSSRQQVWDQLDPGRTRPPRVNGADPRTAWASYALDAELMLVRDPGSADWTAPPGLTLREWLRGGAAGELPAPGPADLDYHLSTLFPPVRPHGHLELRMIDAQPDDGWIVPLAVVAALADDQQAAEEAMTAVEPLWAAGAAGDWPRAGIGGANPWLTAARFGPANAAIGKASRRCFAAARASLGRQSAPPAVLAAVDAFINQYVSNGRCPADDLLEKSGD
jgi:ergothioneine biosynthesis glutamate--cysteine ligase EgtA